mmetsp:Transcript_29040/g.58503  ORF Transcript_29040/g.58503 Transcript_29040/m.58503 type:complete len:171 (+) Transcript_29040:527-1039(+)
MRGNTRRVRVKDQARWERVAAAMMSSSVKDEEVAGERSLELAIMIGWIDAQRMVKASDAVSNGEHTIVEAIAIGHLDLAHAMVELCQPAIGNTTRELTSARKLRRPEMAEMLCRCRQMTHRQQLRLSSEALKRRGLARSNTRGRTRWGLRAPTTTMVGRCSCVQCGAGAR